MRDLQAPARGRSSRRKIPATRASTASIATTIRPVTTPILPVASGLDLAPRGCSCQALSPLVLCAARVLYPASSRLGGRMHTVTLITNPAMVLTRRLSRTCATRWAGADAVWLDPNHAAEFEVAAPAEKPRPGVGTVLQAEGVDMVAQPSEGRKERRCCWPTWTAPLMPAGMRRRAGRGGRRGRSGQRHHETRHERASWISRLR